MEYADKTRQYQEMLANNIKTIDGMLMKTELETSAFPFLHKMLTSYGESNGKKLLSLLEFSLEKSKKPKFTNGDTVIFFVSQRYLASHYGGAVRTWNKCIMRLAALGLIRFHKASKWKQDQGLLTPAQQRSLDEALKRKRMPSNHYSFEAYTPVLLTAAENKEKHFTEKGGNVTGLSKAMLIDIFEQQEANRITDDSRKRTKSQKQAERHLESTIKQLLQKQGYATRDEVVNSLMQASNMNFPVATSHYKRFIPRMQDKYQLDIGRIGTRKQSEMDIKSGKEFIEVIKLRKMT